MQHNLRSLETPLTSMNSPTLEAAVPAAADGISISMHHDPSAIEQIWRGLERRSDITVYQRYDWVAPWCAHAAASQGIEPTILLGSQRGRPVFLLPIGRRRTRLGAEISWLGCSHVNIGLGLFDRAFAETLDRYGTRRLFDRAVRSLGHADYLALHNQPLTWRGTDNPMRHLPGFVEDQPVLAIALGGDFAEMVNSRKRKKLRWQENTLAPVGGYRFFRAENRAEAERVFSVFLKQKQQQFAKLGIRNVFADAGTIACFRAMIAETFGQKQPIIQLYALEIGGEIRATFAAGVHDGRAHGYFSGISLDDYQRVSPGELLLYHLVRSACETAYHTLDLGVGEERYKASWTPIRERQFTTLTGLTIRGRLAVTGLRAAHSTRRRIRSNDSAWRVAKRVRQWRSGWSGRPIA